MNFHPKNKRKIIATLILLQFFFPEQNLLIYISPNATFKYVTNNVTLGCNIIVLYEFPPKKQNKNHSNINFATIFLFREKFADIYFTECNF